MIKARVGRSGSLVALAAHEDVVRVVRLQRHRRHVGIRLAVSVHALGAGKGRLAAQTFDDLLFALDDFPLREADERAVAVVAAAGER